jgi:hypothetical protein
MSELIAEHDQHLTATIDDDNAFHACRKHARRLHAG